MGMNGINLIPAPRRAARRRRAHLRYCAAGCAAWAVVSVGAACVVPAVWGAGDSRDTEWLAKVNGEIQQTERTIAGIRAQLTAAESTLRGNQAIAAQPDWSVLLAVLGQMVGGDVVLKSCHVRPVNPNTDGQRPDARRAAPRAQAEPTVAKTSAAQPFILEAAGIAKDYTSANQFVLRLEQTGLFAKVTLLDTGREAFFDKNAIAFRLECAMNQSAVDAPGRSPVGERPPAAAGPTDKAAPGTRRTAAASAGGGE